MQDDLHDSLLDALKAVSRYEHLDAALILGTEALRLNRDLELVARNDLRVDDARRVILGVDAVEDWLCNNRFSQVAFRVALGDTVVDCLFEVAADDVEVLAYLEEDDRHASILAVRAILIACDFRILDDLVEYSLADWGLLRLAALLEALVDVFRQVISRLLAQLCNGFRDLFCVEFSQSDPSHKYNLSHICGSS